MELTDWQLSRIRNALRAYHASRPIEGKKYNWQDVSEAIDEYTGIVVPKEPLRKFVEGVKQNDGTYKFSVPKPDRLKAIREFVTHADLELLTEDELFEREVDIQVAMRLVDFLDSDADRNSGGDRIGFPDNIAGKYECSFSWPSSDEVLELGIDEPVDACVTTVHLYQREFDKVHVNERMRRGDEAWPDECQSLARYTGWAILTPEDNVQIFLKEVGVGRNRYYITLAHERFRGDSDAPPSFVLLHHDYPQEVLGTGMPLEYNPVRIATEQNSHYFYRKGD